MSNKSLFAATILFVLSACVSQEPMCIPLEISEKVYVIEHGWHAELGIPVDQLVGHLSFLREIFPEAKVIIFGYGKKTFFTAPPKTVSEYILGPFPGPAVVQIVALSVMPDEAYGKEDTTLLLTTSQGMRALEDFIWDDLSTNDQGRTIIVAPSTDPSGLFYARCEPIQLLSHL